MNPPPDHIVTLKDILWYLRYYDYSLFMRDGDEYLSLRDATPEQWATQVAYWIENNMLPARSISEAEYTQERARIEAAGGVTKEA